jgi:hypothetical protein
MLSSSALRSNRARNPAPSLSFQGAVSSLKSILTAAPQPVRLHATHAPPACNTAARTPAAAPSPRTPTLSPRPLASAAAPLAPSRGAARRPAFVPERKPGQPACIPGALVFYGTAGAGGGRQLSRYKVARFGPGAPRGVERRTTAGRGPRPSASPCALAETPRCEARARGPVRARRRPASRRIPCTTHQHSTVVTMSVSNVSFGPRFLNLCLLTPQ